MRKIAVVTGSRAEYGCLYWVLHDIHTSDDLGLQLLVTGAHLAPTFGHTIDLIRQDGFPVHGEVHSLLASDTPEAVAKAIGLGVIGFSDALRRLQPDILLLIADRTETFAAAVAGVALGIPIAHISGGEATEGLFDDQLRHATTKMSHLHFVSMEFYRRRLIRMGEDPARVFTVGEPGLDHCSRSLMMGVDELSKEVGLDFSEPVTLIAFHPVTLELDQTASYVETLLSALEEFPSLQKLFTYPGADPCSHLVIAGFERYVAAHDRCVLHKNLGFRRYLSVLKHARVMVGNSSSGIFEAPSFELPVVNIGSRQGGRVRAMNVIDVACTVEGIVAGIRASMKAAFLEGLRGLKNPYGAGNASGRIVEILRVVDLASLKYKPFYEG